MAPGEDVPGEAGHEEGVEAEVEVEKPSDPLPLQPQEWRHNGMRHLFLFNKKNNLKNVCFLADQNLIFLKDI